MIIVSNNHGESISLNIYYLHAHGDLSTFSAVTKYWAVDNRWKWLPIHKIMGLAYSLIVTCKNKSNTW